MYNESVNSASLQCNVHVYKWNNACIYVFCVFIFIYLIFLLEF